MSDARQSKLAEQAAFVIVPDSVDITQPLAARSIARNLNKGRPSLYGAFTRAGLQEKPGSTVTVSDTGTTYVLPNDCVLLMIGNTPELEAACKVANHTEPCINFIEMRERSQDLRTFGDKTKPLQLRYARIQVSKIPVIGKGQIDTLIALGAKLPASSEKGWLEYDKWPTPGYVATEDVQQEESLPVHIRAIKENHGKKWVIDA
jgi:hypothetical protein